MAKLSGLWEANIKYDMPTCADAIKRTTYYIMNGKSLGYSAVKIIHGYGSTGQGGKIRTEVRKYLDDKVRKHQIRYYIRGEDFSIFDQKSRDAFMLCDDLRRDEDLERHNNGVTFIIF